MKTTVNEQDFKQAFKDMGRGNTLHNTKRDYSLGAAEEYLEARKARRVLGLPTSALYMRMLNPERHRSWKTPTIQQKLAFCKELGIDKNLAVVEG